VKVPKAKKRVLTCEEMMWILSEAKEEWRPSIVLSGFFGLRPEEIAPVEGMRKSRADKRGLHAEEIDWRFRVIRVPEEVAKVSNGARDVPFPEHAEAWLEWERIKPGMKGRVCAMNPTQGGETKRLSELIFGDEE
jgi:hypothetical protein